MTKSKPDPEVFLKGAEGLNVNPKDCLVFEDAAAGIQAAKAAGMMTIGMGGSKEVEIADYRFNSMSDISTAFFSSL